MLLTQGANVKVTFSELFFYTFLVEAVSTLTSDDGLLRLEVVHANHAGAHVVHRAEGPNLFQTQLVSFE